MMPSTRRVALLVAGVAVSGLATIVVPATVAAESFDDDAAGELAERYAPVVMLVDQPEPCSVEGEALLPMSVDAVLDNPQVALRQVGNGDPVVRWGPEASDLFDLGEGFYLDFPGSALAPGCVYEEDFHRFAAELEPTVYAHVVSQDDRPGELAVQYWFYWYYNDWNNKHEGDWEGIQLVFPAATPTEALDLAPSSVGYAQHEGGERAQWDDSKLELDGDHPVVYPSIGSHASYYGAALYLGRSGSEGFGCDDTDGASTSVRPVVELLPAEVDDAGDEHAWLAYDGRWGERQSGPFNGPTGPADKDRWARPIDWSDELRSTSVSVPSPGTRSGDVVDTFCSVVEWGSNQLLALARSPGRALAAIAIAVAVIVYLVRRTDWSRTDPVPLVATRRVGQILRTSAAMFGSAPRVFLTLGVAAIPVAAAGGLLAIVISYLPVIGRLVDTVSRDDSSNLLLAVAASALSSFAAFAFVSAASARVIDDMSADRPPSAGVALRAVGAHWKPLLAVIAVVVLVALTGWLVILAPLAIFVVVRLLPSTQIVVLEQPDGAGAALRRSWRLVRGHWWLTAVTYAVVGLATKLVSGLIGLLILILLRPPFGLLTAIIVALDAVLVTFGAIAAAYLYGHLRAREDAPAVEAASQDRGVRPSLA
jgi:hypothetical protein